MSTPTLVVLALVAASVAAYLLMNGLFLWSLRGGRRVSGQAPRVRVSVLKPLAGVDDALWENLETFARQEDVDYELLLGVASETDAAWPVAEAFVRAHPRLARLVRTHGDAALNPKVAQLIGLARAATGDVVVISDSNVRVRADYLKNLLVELHRPGVGLVSNAIVGDGERTLGAALDNLMLATHTTAGVMSAAALTGRAITMGKSMAMRRADLAAVGGFASVADVLAEDHALGRRFAAAGFKVVVSPDLVENRNVSGTVRRTFDRHGRWAKIRRAMAPAGLAAEPLLAPFALATLGFLLVPDRLTAALVLGTAVLQMIGAHVVLWRLRGRPWSWWLTPLELVRSWLFLGCLAQGWFSRRVVWRGHPLTIVRGTALVPARPPLLRRITGLLLAR